MIYGRGGQVFVAALRKDQGKVTTLDDTANEERKYDRRNNGEVKTNEG